MSDKGLASEDGGSNVTHEDNVETITTPSRPHPNTLEEVSQPLDPPEEVNLKSPYGSNIGIPSSPKKKTLVAVVDEAGEEGYDTDGKLGPFFDGVQDEEPLEEIMEEEIGAGIRYEVPVAAATIDANQGQNLGSDTASTTPPLTQDNIEKMTVKDLRAELEKRGLSRKGLKKELADRLVKAVEENMPLLQNVMVNEGEELAPPDDGFAPQARWKIIDPNDDDIIDEAILQTI